MLIIRTNHWQPLKNDEENLSIALFIKPHWLYAQSIESTEHELIVG